MLQDLYTIIVFFITGILIGILFDIFRITRKSFKTPNIITYIEDILFWILTGCLFLYVMYTFTTGEIRLYMILIIILGSIIYFLSISKYFIYINSKILIGIKKIILILMNPFIWIFKKLAIQKFIKKYIILNKNGKFFKK